MSSFSVTSTDKSLGGFSSIKSKDQFLNFHMYAASTNVAVMKEIRYTAGLIQKCDKEVEARERARVAAEKKVWWVPYNRRPDHPTLHHKNSPLTTPIPGPEEVYPQAPAFSPTPAGNVTNCKKRPREPCTCTI